MIHQLTRDLTKHLSNCANSWSCKWNSTSKFRTITFIIYFFFMNIFVLTTLARKYPFNCYFISTYYFTDVIIYYVYPHQDSGSRESYKTVWRMYHLYRSNSSKDQLKLFCFNQGVSRGVFIPSTGLQTLSKTWSIFQRWEVMRAKVS